jgi:hypothetical protein
MNTADATCSKAKKKRLQQAALPGPFAVRAGPSARPIPSACHPADLADPNQRTPLSIPTRLLLSLTSRYLPPTTSP